MIDIEWLQYLTNLLCFLLQVNGAESFPSPLSAKKEAEMIEKMEKGDKHARETLIEHNLRLVAHIIKKYYANFAEQEDLISIGTIGLIKGIDSFRPEKGTRLATYAARCIENEILMYFRFTKKASQEISFNEPIDADGEGNPLTLMDIVYTDDTIVEEIDSKLKLIKLARLIREIRNPRDRWILNRRYGLDGKPPQTQHEIAEILGISRSYVSRIEKRIIRELRDGFRSLGNR